MQKERLMGYQDVSVKSKWEQAAQFYVWNKFQGMALREIAQKTGCHATTVMRHIQQISQKQSRPEIQALIQKAAGQETPAGARIEDELKRIEKLLNQRGTQLVFAKDMPRAVVMGALSDDDLRPLDQLCKDAAQILVMTLKLKLISSGRVTRYRHASPVKPALWRDKLAGMDTGGTILPVRGETPLSVLARRRNGEGAPFLDRSLIQAGLRLREDFLLSDCQSQIQDDLDAVLVGRFLRPENLSPMAGQALDQLLGALADLGPGLADIALRSCCFEEGLERSETAMGWSARSGKIVLRIALQRLKQHYLRKHGAGGGRIG